MSSTRIHLALALVIIGCGDDKEPHISAGATGLSAEPTATTVMTATMSDDTTGVPTSGGPGTGDPTADASDGTETGDTPSGPYDICQRYIACIAVTTPNGLPDAQSGFGDDSMCWHGTPQDAMLCGEACATGLGQYHTMFPDEPMCNACISDGECDATMGEQCIGGGCLVANVCGNGLVEAGELCDGQMVCGEDCMGAGNIDCSPLTGFGCAADDYCYIERDGTFFGCGGAPVQHLDDGDVCDDPDAMFFSPCGSGLYCASAGKLKGQCTKDGCCTAYCDLGAPDPCGSGFTCQKYFTGSAPYPLDYLGVCLP